MTGNGCGRRLVVVGVGNIGYEVVKLGRGLGMQAAGVDTMQKHRCAVRRDRRIDRRGRYHRHAMNLTKILRLFLMYNGCAPLNGVISSIFRGRIVSAHALLVLLDKGI